MILRADNKSFKSQIMFRSHCLDMWPYIDELKCIDYTTLTLNVTDLTMEAIDSFINTVSQKRII